MSLSSHAEFSNPSLKKTEIEKQDVEFFSSLTKSRLSDEKTSKIFLVHVAQSHYPSDKSISETIFTDRKGELHYKNTVVIDDEIVFSQFNVAKTILANKDAIVLDEGQCYDFTLDVVDFSKSLPKKIKKIFPQGFPNTFDELTRNQKRCLVIEGAAFVLFCLGLLKSIYKTTTNKQHIKAITNLKKKDFFNNPLIINTDSEIKKIICDEREEIALKFVKEAVKKSGKNNPVVLLIYGANHQFGKKIRTLVSSDIVYEGRINTLRDLDEDISISDEKLLHSGSPITPSKQNITLEEFRDILLQYRTTYLSTSIFSSGYRSRAMKALVALLEKIQKDNLKSISYMTILSELSIVDEERAKLFRNGLFHSNKSLKTATDKIILDLRKAYDGELIALDEFVPNLKECIIARP